MVHAALWLFLFILKGLLRKAFNVKNLSCGAAGKFTI
jgi:hypothetical protein